MDNLIAKILKKWLEVSEYSPEQKEFNLLSSNFRFHECGNRIQQLLKWDSSGIFAVLYAKASFETICKGIVCNLLDFLNHPAGLKDYQDIWNMFNCPEMADIEHNAIHNIVRLTSSNPAVGELDSENELAIFRDSIEYIAEELLKCNLEFYSIQLRSQFHKDLKFNATLYVFNTTTECVLNIEKSPDGIYLCYITDFNSCGGYFGYFIKSGPNILSINDRIDESFVGEHTRRRNNRFIEDKKWHIFPYDELLTSEGRDYLGYAKSLVCELKPREIRRFNPANIYPIMLSTALIMKRFANADVDELVNKDNIQRVYIDSLLHQNVSSEVITSIVPVAASSLIIQTTQSIPIRSFNADNVLSNELQSQYDWSSETEGRRHRGTYKDVNKILIDLYGQGFELDKSKVMQRNWPQLTDGASDTVVSEYIGPSDKIELEYYRQSRLQLKEHIIRGMQTAYLDAGGYDGIKQWYVEALRQNEDALIQMAVDWYIKYLNNEVSSYSIDAFGITTSDNLQVSIRERESGYLASRLIREFIINAHSQNNYDLYKCPITGNVANVWFIFVPNTWQNIEKLAGKDVPKILKGFKYSGPEYGGNDLIHSCDPIAFIHNPFESNVKSDYNKIFVGRRSMDFSMAVGFSRRGLNKLVKQRKAANH